jgi:hypothetical protein
MPRLRLFSRLWHGCAVAKIFLTMTHDGLIPIDAESESALKSWKIGQVKAVTVKNARNPLFHRFIMKISSIVCENSDTWNDPAAFVDAVQLTHDIHVEYAQDLYGNVNKRAKSISFETLDEKEFRPIADLVIKEAARILGVAESEILREAHND